MKTRGEIQNLLKLNGAMQAGELADALGVTAMAVRQHLYELEAKGFVAFEEKGKGRGRPAKYWKLTEKADRHFPDAHADLSVSLLASLRDVFGDDGFDRLLDKRAEEQVEVYRRALNGATNLKDKLTRFAEARTAEGYMAAVSNDGDDFLFIENHCPICQAARACSGLCRMELHVFQAVFVAEAEFKREEHILKGARRCAYRVTAKSLQ